MDAIVSAGADSETSVSLTPSASRTSALPGATFEPWYRFFPWEDWREARPAMIERDILPELTRWAASLANSFICRENSLTSCCRDSTFLPEVISWM